MERFGKSEKQVLKDNIGYALGESHRLTQHISDLHDDMISLEYSRNKVESFLVQYANKLTSDEGKQIELYIKRRTKVLHDVMKAEALLKDAALELLNIAVRYPLHKNIKSILDDE